MMRILGLDLGTKTIGIALSDEKGLMALPLVTLRRTGINRDMDSLLALMDEQRAGAVVIGLPVNMDGSKGERARASEKFAERLRRRRDITVTLWDERLSTAAVTRVLIEGGVSRAKRRLSVDKMAAAYILQGYLDSRGSSGEE